MRITEDDTYIDDHVTVAARCAVRRGPVGANGDVGLAGITSLAEHRFRGGARGAGARVVIVDPQDCLDARLAGLALFQSRSHVFAALARAVVAATVRPDALPFFFFVSSFFPPALDSDLGSRFDFLAVVLFSALCWVRSVAL